MIRNEYEACSTATWTDISNPSKEDMDKISGQFGLNEHVVRDCMQPKHLPKYELINDVHFLILRFYAPDQGKKIPTIQELTNKVAIFYTEKFVLTIHKAEAAFLNDIQNKFSVDRKCSSVTVLIAKIIWLALETFDDPAGKLSDEVDFYESQVMMKENQEDHVQALYLIKHRASVLQKVLLLMTEPINHQRPKKQEQSAVQDMHDQYLKMLTLYNQVLDDVNNLMHLSMSISAKRTNEIMRVLTIFSVFFMPLTFIVGIYGMNFKFMPELNKRWGYPGIMILMMFVSVIIYIWFKRKKWL